MNLFTSTTLGGGLLTCLCATAGGTVVALVPVGADAPHSIVGNEIKITGGGGTVEPQWYRCVMPPGAVEAFVGEHGFVDMRQREQKGLDGRHVMCRLLSSGAANKFIGFILDESGRVVDRTVSDAYALDGSLPDPDEFYLGELPPLLERSPRSGDTSRAP